MGFQGAFMCFCVCLIELLSVVINNLTRFLDVIYTKSHQVDRHLFLVILQFLIVN